MDPLTAWTPTTQTFFSALPPSTPPFTRDPTSTPLANFTRLARTLHWPLVTFALNYTRCFAHAAALPALIPPHGGNAYFDAFRDRGFVPDSRNRLEVELCRLAAHVGWIRGGAEWRTERTKAYAAEAEGFWKEDGETQGRLEGWRVLCGMLYVRGVMGSIGQCRKALRGRYVNLVDLMDARRVRAPVRVFSSLEALEKYTRSSKKTFPLAAAKKSAIVRYLLGNFSRRAS